MTNATLSLNFTLSGEKTVLRVLRQDPPWRALRAFSNSSGEALIHLHNVSGGILGGDKLALEATVQPRTRAQISAVSATRVYRSRADGSPACQATKLYVGRDALLEYLPDTVIPFAHSRFEQKTEIYLAEGAGLIWWETLSAGRVAGGEAFAFDHMSVDTSIYSGQRPVAIERYSLCPKLHELSCPARFGRFLYSSTMYVCRAGYVCHPGKSLAEWMSLENELNLLGREISTDSVKWGASALVSDGVVVRGMAQSAQQINDGLRAMWQTAKQSVWQRPALAPRRIY
jgi:urease accessory protein